MKISGQPVPPHTSSKRLREHLKAIPSYISSCPLLPLGDCYRDNPDGMFYIGQHQYGFASDRKLATDNLQQCCAVVLYDPVVKKAALLHVDYQATQGSVENAYHELYQGNPLKVYLVGGEERKKEPVSKSNVRKVMRALRDKDVDVFSADVGGKIHPTAIVFDPVDGQLYQGNTIIRQRYGAQGEETPGSRGEIGLAMNLSPRGVKEHIERQHMSYGQLALSVLKEMGRAIGLKTVGRRELLSYALLHATVENAADSPLQKVEPPVRSDGVAPEAIVDAQPGKWAATVLREREPVAEPSVLWSRPL